MSTNDRLIIKIKKKVNYRFLDFEPLPYDYIVICDSSIMFCGSKIQCLEYYNNLPNPMTMTLIRIGYKKELRRN